MAHGTEVKFAYDNVRVRSFPFFLFFSTFAFVLGSLNHQLFAHGTLVISDAKETSGIQVDINPLQPAT
jgi:hypothetical protein